MTPFAPILMQLAAAPDTEALQLAYAPHPALRVGAHRTALHLGRSRLGVSALVEIHDVARGNLLPNDAHRLQLQITSHRDVAGVGKHGALTVGVAVGHASARLSRTATAQGLQQPRDIPFGGGGWFLAPEVSVELERGTLDVWGRLRHRWYTNAWPRLFGETDAALTVATLLEEGVSHAPSADVVFRWNATERVSPVMALHAGWLVPSDPIAEPGGRLRGSVGVAIAGPAGTWVPFASAEVGNGAGVLIAERAVRMGGGVRVAW